MKLFSAVTPPLLKGGLGWMLIIKGRQKLASDYRYSQWPFVHCLFGLGSRHGRVFIPFARVCIEKIHSALLFALFSALISVLPTIFYSIQLDPKGAVPSGSFWGVSFGSRPISPMITTFLGRHQNTLLLPTLPCLATILYEHKVFFYMNTFD